MATSDKKYFWRDGDPLWYKDAVIYKLHVRAFYDSDGDGIGDFLGLTEKLDYLQDLGVTAIWLLPFYPSPFKDDGYAAYAALRGQASTMLRPEDLPVLKEWAWSWYLWGSATFLKSYLEFMADTPILPQSREGTKVILDTYLLDKALYEVNYELNNRPDWVGLPLQGILQMLQAEAEPVKTMAQAAREPEDTAKEARGKAEQQAEK